MRTKCGLEMRSSDESRGEASYDWAKVLFNFLILRIGAPPVSPAGDCATKRQPSRSGRARTALARVLHRAVFSRSALTGRPLWPPRRQTHSWRIPPCLNRLEIRTCTNQHLMIDTYIPNPPQPNGHVDNAPGYYTLLKGELSAFNLRQSLSKT
jgi:hypothetical protein